jgi:hypothetical protein
MVEFIFENDYQGCNAFRRTRRINGESVAYHDGFRDEQSFSITNPSH